MRVLAICLLTGLSACAAHERPIAIWFRNSPKDWTPPQRFAHCTVNGEVVIENGKPNGRDTVRMDCLKEEETVYLDKNSKRVVWRERWWGSS